MSPPLHGLMLIGVLMLLSPLAFVGFWMKSLRKRPPRGVEEHRS